jgi:hypothetical protein
VLEGEVHQLRQIIGADAFRFGFEVHARRGQGQTAEANSDPHHHVGGLVERAKRCLKPGHSRNREAHVRKPKHIHEVKLTKGELPQTRSALLARIKEIKRTHAKSKAKLAAHRP